MIFFKTVLGQLHFNVNIVNSIIVAGCMTLIAITISARWGLRRGPFLS
ncbi:MAG: hypothetical protein ACLSAF_23190 [Intestinimonas sp.]